MAKLPDVNPIDAGYMHRGGAVDHLGTTTIFCQACGSDQKAERYRMIMGRQFGFGAPHYISPFLKRSSTKGKIGKRGTYALCCECQSLWSQDQGARESLENLGADPDGVVADHMAYETLNRSIEEEETMTPGDEPPKSRVRKLPPDTPRSEQQPKPQQRPKPEPTQTSSRTCTYCQTTTTLAQQRFCEQCGADLNNASRESTGTATAPVTEAPEASPLFPQLPDDTNFIDTSDTTTMDAIRSDTVPTADSDSKTSQQRESNKPTTQDEGDDLSKLGKRIQDLRQQSDRPKPEKTSTPTKDAEPQLSPDELRAQRTKNRAVRTDPEVRRLREELKEAEERAREQRKREELKKRQAEERAREKRKQEELKKRQEETILQFEIQRDAQKLKVKNLETELLAAETHLAEIKNS